MQMAMRRMMGDVPKADVIITNPTHYSVALKYDAGKPGAAPKVLAKGVDEVAMKIREIAREYDIPVMSSPPLTRAIYHATEIGQEIPEGLFAAVAQVLAYVYQLKKFRRGRGRRPTPLAKDLPIPTGISQVARRLGRRCRSPPPRSVQLCRRTLQAVCSEAWLSRLDPTHVLPGMPGVRQLPPARHKLPERPPTDFLTASK